MDTIAIVNEKGGTGKTTTAVNLSAALGELGKKVLLVDLDGQAASSRWLGVEEDTRFADALWRGEGLEPIPEVVPGVSLVPGSGKLDSVAHDLRPTQGGQLRKLLSQVTGFDYAIVDCPPSLGNRLIGNALLAAASAIVPVETSILALDGLKILLTTFEDIREGFGHEIVLAGVLACRYDVRTCLSRCVLAELKRALPGKVFETVIRENVRVRECPGSGQSVLTYAPDSHAAEDYRALAREFLARQAGAVVAVRTEEHPADAAAESLGLTQMRKRVEEIVARFSPARSAQAAPVEGAPEDLVQAGADWSDEAPRTDAPGGGLPPAEGEPQADAETIEAAPAGEGAPVAEPAHVEVAAADDQARGEPPPQAGPPATESPQSAEPAPTPAAEPEPAPPGEPAAAGTREQEPAPAEQPPPEAEPAQEPPEPREDYPALRAMLRRIKQGEEAGAGEKEPATADAAR